MQKVISRAIAHWSLALLALLAILARVYKIEHLTYFTYDESIPAFVGKNMLELGKFPLIGGVTPFGFHLTPYFYWLLAGTIAIGNLNPVSWGITSAVLSALTVILLFKAGIEFFSKRVGVYAAVIWTFSYIANIYDRHFWALYWGPILALATLLSLKKIIDGNKWYLIILAVIFIWSIATDPSNLVFIFFSVLIYARKKISLSKAELIALVLVLFSLVPLIVFDIRHNFANTKPFLNYLQADKSESRFENQDFMDRSAIFANSFSRLIYPFTDNEVGKQYSYCASFIKEKYENIPLPMVVVSSFLILGFLLFSIKSKKNEQVLIALLIAVYFVGIQAYGIIFNGDIFEHYITGLFPVFVLLIAKALSKLPRSAQLVTIAFFVFFSVLKLSQAKNSHGLFYKKQSIEFALSSTEGKSFSLESLSSCWRYSGYRYLYSAFGKDPIKSYVDPNLGHLYAQTGIAENHPDTVIAIVTHDFRPESSEFYETYALYKSHETSSSISGNIETIVMDNTGKWFK